MPLYKILPDGRTLRQVARKEFSNEAELHSLVENNLQGLLSVRLIAGEYPIPNGRIDTLGLDEYCVPVIIEYKWKKELSAAIQGLFYLDWVVQNKRPFESIVRDKLGKDAKVDWSTQPRLLIIAQDFDIKELAAINQMGPRIELIKYSFYDGLLSYEYVNIVETKATITKPTEQMEHPEFTIESLLQKASPDVRDIFMKLRESILGISDNPGRCHVVHVVVASPPPGPATPGWLRCRVASCPCGRLRRTTGGGGSPPATSPRQPRPGSSRPRASEPSGGARRPGPGGSGHGAPRAATC